MPAAPEILDQAQLRKILESADPSSSLYQRCKEILAENVVVAPPTPLPTPRLAPRFLTIGMATHDDYDGCYFTIQSIRLHHPEILADVEFLVVDNNPTGASAKPLKDLENWIPNYRYFPYRCAQGTAVRDLVFREASGEFVLCTDSHVLFPPGSLRRLIEYCRVNSGTTDLLQGPLISDALEPLASHFNPVWSHGMYGQWGMDERAKDADAPPFDIGMQGLGVFVCRREAWPGFNPRLAGFGGEEGYLHEKIRRAGGRTLCLPFLRWMHRFARPSGIPYSPSWEDRIRNYLFIYDELGMDPEPVISHFRGFLGRDPADRLIEAVRNEMAGPFHYFDSIYCINLDRQADRWNEMQARFRRLGIARAVRRFPAVETPGNHHIGCALSHRGVIAEARQRQLNTVLVFEDDARFTSDCADVLKLSLQELEGREWQILYLGGYGSDKADAIPGCQYLAVGNTTCTHAVAYHHSVYERILETIPENPKETVVWAKKYLAIDQYFRSNLHAERFITRPVISTQSSILPAETRVFED